MSVIRILHIVGAMNRGGTETLLMELYRHIDRSKIQFDFLVYNYTGKPAAYDEEIISMGGKIYEAKRKFYKGPIRYIKELKQFFHAHPEYKIVHAHQYATSGYMLAVAKKINNCITVAHSHIAFPVTDVLRRFADSIGKKLLSKYADYIFGCSDDAIVALTGKHADNKTRFVMKNAIDSDKFSFSPKQREKWRQEFGCDQDTLVVGNIARFTYQKNHEFLVEIFSRIVDKFPNSKLILVGVGGKEEIIRQQVSMLGLNEKVIFMGSRPDVEDIENAFDVFLMPSRFEGLGIVLIEAQANGLHCVISSDVIPQEADVNAGLVTRVKLSDTPEEWAESCLNVRKRLAPIDAQVAVRDAGYDIKEVTKWLQDFYISHWSE